MAGPKHPPAPTPIPRPSAPPVVDTAAEAHAAQQGSTAPRTQQAQDMSTVMERLKHSLNFGALKNVGTETQTEIAKGLKKIEEVLNDPSRTEEERNSAKEMLKSLDSSVLGQPGGKKEQLVKSCFAALAQGGPVAALLMILVYLVKEFRLKAKREALQEYLANLKSGASVGAQPAEGTPAAEFARELGPSPTPGQVAQLEATLDAQAQAAGDARREAVDSLTGTQAGGLVQAASAALDNPSVPDQSRLTSTNPAEVAARGATSANNQNIDAIRAQHGALPVGGSVLSPD